MYVDVTFDSSVASAPAGFKACVNAVCQYYDALFTNNVSLSVTVGWGEVAGQSIDAGALGESSSYYVGQPYSQVVAALKAQTAPGSSTLPQTSPAAGTLQVTTAQALALGLGNFSQGNDGAIGIDASASWAIDPTQSKAVPSQSYDMMGVIEHELSEVMGRSSNLDQSRAYSVLDLYRYASDGVRQLTTGDPSYFSIDGGRTLGLAFNNYQTGDASGDLGDWAGNIGTPDSYGDGFPGEIGPVSATDKVVMAAIGWTTTAASTALSVAGAVPVLSAAAAIAAIDTAQDNYVAVSDSGANISAQFDGLESLARNATLSTITLSSPSTISLTAAQLSADGDALAILQGSYLLAIDATSGSNLSIAGLAGHGNVVVLSSTASQYTIAAVGDGVSFTISSPAIGTDHLSGVLQVQFSDKTLTVAGNHTMNEDVALLYQGALGRTPDPAGLQNWDTLANALPASTQALGVYGLSDASGNYNGTLSIAGGFTNSAEFVAKYGSLTNAQFVTQLYSNILDRAPDTQGYATWMGELSAGQSREHVLVGFADSAEAISNATQGFVGQSGSHAAWLFLT
jgi:hypothetical protein